MTLIGFIDRASILRTPKNSLYFPVYVEFYPCIFSGCGTIFAPMSEVHVNDPSCAFPQIYRLLLDPSLVDLGSFFNNLIEFNVA